MLQNIRRYARAFVLALRYTVRGEKPPLLQVHDQHPDLSAWWAQTIKLVGAVEAAAAAGGIDPAAVKLHIDKRDISMKTILATVRFHAERDYPYLVAHSDAFDAMTLHATNLNDRYLVMQLANSTQLGDNAALSIKPAVDALNTHLASLPSQ